MKKQKGFSLIELVAGIVILAVLASFAEPKFLNIQSDAKDAVLKGLQGSLKSMTQQVYAKASIRGVERAGDATVKINQHNIKLTYGYPIKPGQDGLASLVDGLEGLNDAGFDNGQWKVRTITYGSYSNTIVYSLADSKEAASSKVCSVSYEAFTTIENYGQAPKVTMTSCHS